MIYLSYDFSIKKEGERVENVRFKPQIDRFFWFIWIPTVILLAVCTAIACASTVALLIMLAADIFTLYFLISPLFGYVELREQTVYIKFGFFTSREIEYSRIRSVNTERKWYSESMLLLKCAYEHVNIKYGSFDVVTVRVDSNAALALELELRSKAKVETLT